ncbi:MAG TPA: dienelactone hydrolase family protein [Pyrinomonadaceae bacterium]|nr:dienelactone hydrolase family protein [Pyrinomonadaceae bacterium]
MESHEELVGLLPEELTRRRFVVTSLFAGFALAVRPAAGQSVITTDTQGLVAGEVKIPVRDGEIPAYRAMPEKGKNFPVVLVVQEIFGVHEHIKDICRRFAKLGHMAIAPELYARQGDTAQLKEMSKILEIVAKVPDAQVMSDLDASVAYAEATGKGNSKRLGITGFCWGGRAVWLYAAHNPDLDAGVAWYGRLVARSGQPANPSTPRQPVDVAGELKAPVLGLYGGKDQGIPLDTVERMREALKKSESKAARESEIVVYPEAGHGFHADYRPMYDKEAAADGWRRLLAWFKKHGAA